MNNEMNEEMNIVDENLEQVENQPVVQLLQVGIYDGTTGINTVREMTEEEIAEREAERIAFEEAKAAKAAEKAEKAAKRAEILERLGLTEDEAKLILS